MMINLEKHKNHDRKSQFKELVTLPIQRILKLKEHRLIVFELGAEIYRCGAGACKVVKR